MKRLLARSAYWTLYRWFALVCEATDHVGGCLLLNRGPMQWAWRRFGHYGDYGFAPRRKA